MGNKSTTKPPTVWIPWEERCRAVSADGPIGPHGCDLRRKHKGEHECACCGEWWSERADR